MGELQGVLKAAFNTFRRFGIPAKMHRSSVRRDGQVYPAKEIFGETGIVRLQASGVAYDTNSGRGWRRVGAKQATK